jgi:hypothetical protein
MSTCNLHQTARGFYRVAVVDAPTQKVVWEQKDWGKNLILNNGMDQVALQSWESCFLYGAAGTGTASNLADSNEVLADQSATTVTATLGSYTFISGDIGNMIHWDDGSEARITAYTSPQSVEVTPSQSVVQQHFVVYQTNQTGLAVEVKRTGNYLNNWPNTGTTIDLGTGLLTLRRTYDFTAEIGSIAYREAATCWSLTPNASNTIFSRIVFPSPIVVDAGQQLRFVYELQLLVGPVTPVVFNAAVTGWPVAPSMATNARQQLQYHGMGTVLANGGSGASTAGTSNEPSSSGLQNCAFWASPNSTAIPSFGSTVNRNVPNSDTTASSLVAYTPLNFYRDKTATFGLGQLNNASIQSLGTGPQAPIPIIAARDSGIVVLLDESESKLNTQTLSFTFRYAWSRVLS